MSMVDAGEIDEERYQEWLAGRPERIAPRKARRLGEVATQPEMHAIPNASRIIDDALQHNHNEHIKEASGFVARADDFLTSLDELLPAS